MLNFTIAVNGGTARAVTCHRHHDTNITVSVDGGPATNYAVADADAVTGADMVRRLNAGFAGASHAGRDHVSGATGAAARVHVRHRASATASRRRGHHRLGHRSRRLRQLRSTAGGALTKTGAVAQTVDQLVAGINTNTTLTDKVTASNDGGRLRISNLSTGDLTVVGATAGGVINGDTGGANTTTIGGNDVRRNLVKQFNDLRDQLDKLADDASFNGVNLLRGDKLKVNFNETRHQRHRDPGAGRIRRAAADQHDSRSASTCS